MTTRGIAVISGSNTVVTRILENGTAVFGADKPIDLRISGNLVLDLSGSSGTSGYLWVDSAGSSSLLGITVSASQVSVVPSGNLSSNNVQSAFYELQDNINTLSGSLGLTAGTGIVINGNVVSASNVPNSSLQNSSINLNGNNIDLGGTGSVGIVREIQAGNSITVTNGSSSIATIALSSTVNGITNLSAVNISSSNFTGNGSNITGINTSNINNFTLDVRNQFSEGTGIQINGGGSINVSNAPNSSLQNSSINLNGVSLSLGSTGSVGITREIQAGANITIANGTSDTATVALSSSLTGLNSINATTISATTANFTTITASVISASSYIGISAGGSTPGGINTTVQFNSGSTFSGSTNLIYNYITNTLSGTTAQLTTLTASNAYFGEVTGTFTGSGAGLYNITASGISNFTSDVRAQFSAGTGIAINSGVISASNIVNASLQNSSININGSNISLGATGSVGIVREIQAGSNIGITGGTSATASISLSSSLTGLTSVSATTISGTTATFSVLTASVISASSYLGITAGATPGGINQSVQFNSGSTLSGSSNLIYNYTTNTLSGTTAQFTTITASNVTIGDAEDGTYTDGLFTTFTSLTPIGLVVDRFNEVLKGLAPSQAPSLANLERNTAGGNNAILSFGATSPTASYFNVTASLAGLANTDIGGTYNVINGAGSNPIRLGVFTALTALTATLNNNTTANAGAFTNYPAKAFNVSNDGIGSFIIEMNDVILTPTGSTITTASYSANNFALGLANTASFIGTGLAFDLFRHRTGSVSIPTASWRLGENYFKVTQVSSLGTQVTNYIDWVYDPQAATGNSVFTFTTTSSSFTVSGLKALSGVKYYQTCSFNFTSSVGNFYKNVYSTAGNGGITFSNLTNGLTATAFASTPVPVTSNDILQRSSLHTLAGVRILSGTLASSMTVNNTLGKTGTTVLTTPTILFDNVNTANSNTLENFCFEDFRVISASYDTQIALTGAPVYESGSNLSASELAVYSGSVVYPTRIFNSGNVAGSGIVYMTGSQPNYSGSIENRFYLRKFVNGASTLATFNLILTGSNINFTAFGGALTTNNVKITVKVPGKTGWRDVLTAAPPNTTGVALNDNVGCLAGSAPANITTVAGRSIAINLLTEAIGANENYIIRILASKDWTGNLTRIQIA